MESKNGRQRRGQDFDFRPEVATRHVRSVNLPAESEVVDERGPAVTVAHRTNKERSTRARVMGSTEKRVSHEETVEEEVWSEDPACRVPLVTNPGRQVAYMNVGLTTSGDFVERPEDRGRQAVGDWR